MANPTRTVWYCDSPIGVHVLQQTVGKLCAMAGFKGYFTNHSLRATAATRLYSAGVDEQLITEKTGHRSSAVRSYKRTSDQQLSEISHILQGQSTSKKEKIGDPDTDKRESSRPEIHIQCGNTSVNLKF